MLALRIVAVALIAAWCGSAVGAAPDIETLEKSIVRVIVQAADDGGTGSGFVLNAAGHIATNEHVTAGHSSLAVHLSGDATLLPARLVWSSEELDLAVVKVDGGNWSPIRLATQIPAKGDPVYSLGFPGDADAITALGAGAEASVAGGELSRVIDGAWHTQPLKILQHTARIYHGSSGGPLIDACGRVIGVNTSGHGYQIKDSDGVVQSVPTGIFAASAIEALTAALQQQSIDHETEDTACDAAGVPATGGHGTRMGGEEANAANWIWLATLLPGLALLAIMVLLFQLRRQMSAYFANFFAPPSERKQSSAAVSEQVDGLSLSATRGDGALPRIAVPNDAASRPQGFVLGRHPQLADHVVDDSKVSRRHLRIMGDGGRFTAQDLNSANGTRLNGKRLRPYQKTRIKAGDRLTCGNLEFRVDSSANE